MERVWGYLLIPADTLSEREQCICHTKSLFDTAAAPELFRSGRLFRQQLYTFLWACFAWEMVAYRKGTYGEYEHSLLNYTNHR